MATLTNLLEDESWGVVAVDLVSGSYLDLTTKSLMLPGFCEAAFVDAVLLLFHVLY